MLVVDSNSDKGMKFWSTDECTKELPNVYVRKCLWTNIHSRLVHQIQILQSWEKTKIANLPILHAMHYELVKMYSVWYGKFGKFNFWHGIL